MDITLTISRSKTLEEIAKTTGYTGSKLLDKDTGAYLRISTTDSDSTMLERYWQESRDNVCMALRRMIATEHYDGDEYAIALRLSEAFDSTLAHSLQRSVECYFVHSMTARWLTLVGSEKAAEYTASAADLLADIERKALCKRAPSRPTYHNNKL